MPVRGSSVRVVTGGVGSPAVLFDSALGMPLEAWSLVAPAIAEQSQVILWDRPGIGGSDAFVPLDAAGMAGAMGAVLDCVGSGAVVAVGHSRGGINVLALAACRPDLIAGVVLVESSHPEQLKRMPDIDGPLLRAARLLAKAPRPAVQVPVLAMRSIVRLAGDRPRPGVRAMAELAPAIARRIDGFVAELDAGPTLLADTGRELADRGFPDVPLVVLTGEKNFTDASDQRIWAQMHGELAALNERGNHVHVDCGHEMPFSRPDAVIEAITQVLEQAGGQRR